MDLSDDIKRKLDLAFRPHSPIEDPASFQGRKGERARVEEALRIPGLHVVVFGERGAGKTSLVNVATLGRRRIQVFCQKDSLFSSVCGAVLQAYAKMDPPRIIYDAQAGVVKQGGATFTLAGITGNDLRGLLPSPPDQLCIVLDELDRIKDVKTLEQIAELCKNLSTYQTNITMVLVGVAATAESLLKGHASNVRNLRQVQLERMTPGELHEILRHAESVLNLTFSEDVKQKLIMVSDRFPYFVHLIGRNSAKAALERGSTLIEKAIYEAGLAAAATDCDAELGNEYERAISSSKQSEIYRRIIWSVAKLEQRVVTPQMIVEQVNGMAKGEGDLSVTPQAVGAALKNLVERRKILTKESDGLYRFRNPLMRGYVRLVRDRL